jgi:hypothetical protein
MIRAIRDSLSEMREAWVMNQRAFCYLRGRRVGYAVPLRDKAFSRPWAWVAYGWDNDRLGVFATLPEAKSRVFIYANDPQIQMSHPSTGVV